MEDPGQIRHPRIQISFASWETHLCSRRINLMRAQVFLLFKKFCFKKCKGGGSRFILLRAELVLTGSQ